MVDVWGAIVRFRHEKSPHRLALDRGDHVVAFVVGKGAFRGRSRRGAAGGGVGVRVRGADGEMGDSEIGELFGELGVVRKVLWLCEGHGCTF